MPSFVLFISLFAVAVCAIFAVSNHHTCGTHRDVLSYNAFQRRMDDAFTVFNWMYRRGETSATRTYVCKQGAMYECRYINTAHGRPQRSRIPSASRRRTVYVCVYSNSIPFATWGSAASLRRRPRCTAALTNIMHATRNRDYVCSRRPLHCSNLNLVGTTNPTGAARGYPRAGGMAVVQPTPSSTTDAAGL